jgi:trimethylguanosine synthase
MVTPEEISAHHAAACASSIVVDATAGIGGVTVHLGRTCGHVIAVEMDAVRAAIVQHNCCTYGVAQYVDVVLGDFLCVSSRFKADVVLITPPYGHMSLPQSTNLTETPFEQQSATLGGKSYASTGSFDLSLLPVDISHFVSVARSIAPSYALVLPRCTTANHNRKTQAARHNQNHKSPNRNCRNCNPKRLVFTRRLLPGTSTLHRLRGLPWMGRGGAS